jgi:rare lipoprotein A
MTKLANTGLCLAAALTLTVGLNEATQADDTASGQTRTVAPKPLPDLSARKRVGKASFYAKQFYGKTMADGQPMDPRGDNAASRTLPLGTTAKVTNIETGKTAVVTIEDRGPYVDGRLVDLSPGTAAKIGLTPRKGVTEVVVAPIAVPLPDGGVKTGAAAHERRDEPDKVPAHDKQATREETVVQTQTPKRAHRKHGETELAEADLSGKRDW